MPLIQFSNLNKYGTIRKRILYTPSMPFKVDPRGLGPLVSVSMFKYRHEHHMPPALMVAHNGKKYIVPTWIEVLPETTLDDVEWIKPVPKDTVKVKDEIKSNTWRFESKSEPGLFYTVTQKGDKFKCNCSGFFRCRDKNIGCKHIKEVKKNTK